MKYAEYTSSEILSGRGVFGQGLFDNEFFPQDDETVCDTEFESTVNAEERVPDPKTVSPYWIADLLDPSPEDLLDTLLGQLALLWGTRAAAINHGRRNALRSWGLLVYYRNKNGETQEKIGRDFGVSKAVISRHALKLVDLLSRYTDLMKEINAERIIEHLGGDSISFEEFHRKAFQLTNDVEAVFRLVLDSSTSRSGLYDPIIEIFDKKSSYRNSILSGQKCSRQSINRISTFLNHIEIPPKPKQKKKVPHENK